jgi:hypothetical protein
VLFRSARVAWADARGSEPLGVPGAERIALPADIASALRITTENARAHGDVLFSLPGLYSFNLWSDRPTPTLANVTHWFSLLDAGRQQEIIDRLEQSPRPVFIVQHYVLGSLMEGGIHPAGPLMEHLRHGYHRAFAVESYSFWVRNGRRIAPLSTGRIRRTDDPAPGGRVLDLTLAERTPAVAVVELWDVVGGTRHLLTLNEGNCAARTTLLAPDDSAAGPDQPAAWPIRLAHLCRLSLRFVPPQTLPRDDHLLAVLRAADGTRIGAARVLAPEAAPVSAAAPPTPD